MAPGIFAFLLVKLDNKLAREVWVIRMSIQIKFKFIKEVKQKLKRMYPQSTLIF